MVMLDTNIILRYLLNDDVQMASEAETIIKNMSVQVNIEIVAEVMKLGIETYAEQNLDFPDCILYAYYKVKGYEIKTFDRKLNKLLAQ